MPGPYLSHEAALAELNRINGLPIEQRLPALQALVESMDASAPSGRTGLLYSGDFRTNASLVSVHSGELARLMARSNNQFAIIDDTPLGRLLNTTQFEAAVRDAAGGDASVTRNLMGGAASIDNAPTSFWGRASQRFVGSLSGPVATLVGNSNPGRVFGAIELQAALNNPAITSVAGLSTDSLRGIGNIDEAFSLVKARALLNDVDIHIGYGLQWDFDGTPLAVNGEQTRGVFASVPDEWAVNNGLSANSFEAIDTTRGRFTDGGTEVGARRLSLIISETPGLIEALRKLKGLGRAVPVAGAALTALYAITGTADAAELYNAGDRRGGAIRLAQTYGNIAGSELFGTMAAVAGAPLLALGPPGWVAYGTIVVGSALIGGHAGELVGTLLAGGQVVASAPDHIYVDLYDLYPPFSGPIDWNLFDLPEGFAVQNGHVVETATHQVPFIGFETSNGQITLNENGRVTPLIVVSYSAGNIIRIDLPQTVNSEGHPTTVVIRTDGTVPADAVAQDWVGILSGRREGPVSEDDMVGVDRANSAILPTSDASDFIDEVQRRQGVVGDALDNVSDGNLPPDVRQQIINSAVTFHDVARFIANDGAEFFRFDLSTFSGIFGSALGNYLAEGDAFREVVFSATASSILTVIGEFLEGGGRSPGGDLPSALEQALSGDLLENVTSRGVGAISSYLTGELVSALGIEGDIGSFVSSTGSAVVNQIVSNLSGTQIWADEAGRLLRVNADGVLTTDGTGSVISAEQNLPPGTDGHLVDRPWNLDLRVSFAAAAASFLGGKLADSIHEFDTVGGQIGAALGQAYGAWNVARVFMQIGPALATNPLVLAAAIVVVAIWKLIGGAIGTLINGTPKAGADLYWDRQSSQFAVGGVWSKHGGSKDTVRMMASNVAEVLNGIVSVTGSVLVHPEAIRAGSYELKGKKYWYKSSPSAPITFQTKDAQALVLHGAFVALGDLADRLVGGDIFAKRALAATLTRSGANSVPGTFEIEALYGNLTYARDFQRYLVNSAAIDELVRTDTHSAFAAGWTVTLAAAADLGLDRRWRTDWLGGWGAFLDETFNGAIDGEAFAPENVELILSEETYSRLFAFLDGDGRLAGFLGDTVQANRKTVIRGSGEGDEIRVVFDEWVETQSISETITVGANRSFFNRRTNSTFTIDPETHYSNQPIQLAEGVLLVGENSVAVTRDIEIARSGWRVQDADGLSVLRRDAEGGAAFQAIESGASDQIRVAAFLDGGAGNDVIRGGDLGNDLLGGDGNDTLVGGALDDWQFGGAGNDRLFAGDVADVSFSDIATDAPSQAARDAAVSVDGGNGDYLYGGEGDDFIYGGRGSDWLNGGAGVDRLVGGNGGDILDGGAGDDRGANGEAMLMGGAGSDQYVFYFGAGNDVIFDSSDPASVAGSNLYAANTRYAFLGQNPGARNWAGNGDYEVDGSVVGGEDAISFGAGIGFEDISLQRGTTSGVANSDLVIELSALNASGVRVATGDTLTIRDWFDDTRKVEWLRFADGQDIRIGDISSIIIGPNAGDSIIGTDGNDWAVGTSDDDDFKLLNGDDFGFGGKGDDFVGGDGDNDFLSGGDDADFVRGGAGHDTAFGDAGNDTVEGNEGNDIVVGGRGNDRVVGGAGNDLYRFSRGDGRDVVLDDYAANTTTEIIFNPGDSVNDYERTQDWRAMRAAMSDVIDDNFWNLPVLWDGTTGTMRERTGSVSVSNAGLDTFEFGYGIDIEDIQLARIGDDLVLAIAGGSFDASAFMDIADRITFESWIAVPGQIERFSFAETGLLDISSWYLGGAATDGADSLNGDAGGASRKDWLTGGLGDDLISGGGEDDILSGNFGADKISGGAGNDVIYGGGDNDVIEGGAGADIIFGGAGEDIASYANGANQYVGVHASLRYSFMNTLDADGDTLVDVEGLEGSAKNDELWGDEGDNVLRGLAGNDILKGDFGHDTYEVNAGEGDDVISDSGIAIEVIIDENGQLSPGFTVDWQLIDTIDMWGGNWYVFQLTVTRDSNGEIIYQSRPHGDFVYTSASGILNNPPPPASWPFGNGQWMVGARAGGGVQTVIESVIATEDAGFDTLELGANISLDDISASRQNNGADLKLSFAAGGSVTIQNHFSVIGANNERTRAVEELLLRDGLAANLANVRLGSDGGTTAEDLYLGGVLDESFDGDAGDDVISGAGGNDTLVGGAGNDTFEGGAGADSFDGGSDSVTNDHAARRGNGLASYGDTIRYVGSDAAVSIDLQGATNALRASGGDAAGDTFTGIENVVGSAFNDVLKGDDPVSGQGGHNQLAGLGGNDVIDGRGGDDVLLGGDGDDTISGGAGADAIDGGAGADTIDGGVGADQISAGEGDDTINAGDGADQIDAGAGADTIHGGADKDTIGGGDGADIVFGDDGDDVLAGGAGADQIYGGDGADTIVGGEGNDLLYGGAGDDAYVFDAQSGADQVIDAAGDKNTISFDGVTFDKIWMAKAGLDLKITLVGSDSVITVKDYYAPSGATRISSISAGDRVLYLAHADALITAMTAVGSTAPAVVSPAISALFATYWETGAEAAPRAANQTLSLNEDESLSGTVAAIDPDDQTLSYVLNQGPAYGTLTFVPATHTWTYQPDANWNGVDAFEVAVTDTDGQTSIEHISLTVNAVNDAPTITAPTLSIAENVASGTVVGTLSASDLENEAVTFSQQTNAGGRFAISATGEITVINGALLNFENGASYQIDVTASDGHDSTNQTITISLADVNEAPTALGFVNATTSLAENTSTTTRTKVADLNVTDDALGSESFSLAGADAAMFEIVDGALYLKAGVTLNYEAKTSYTVTVNVDDTAVGASPDASQVFTLAVSDVNEAPTALAFTNVTASLSDTTSTASRIHVADLNITDDALGSETLGLTGADAASFEIYNGALYLRAGVTLNAATQSSYNVSVTVDDTTLGTGAELSQSFNLNVGAGLSLALANTVTSIAENASTATRIKVADLVIADDAGTPTLSLTGADAASFEIVNGALYLKAGVGLNFEAKSSYAVTVVMDEVNVGSGPDLTRNFTLTVSDVNEAPTALSFANTTTSLAENTSTASRIKVADLNITDDALGSETISLSGADASSFEIFNGALYLKAGVALNFEAKSSYAVTVNVDDSTVGATPDLSQTFNLTITDVNEAPTALSFANTTTSLAENASTASRIKVADLNISDDALGAEGITLTGADASSFEIFNGALYLKAGVALNFEAKSSYAVTVNVDDNTVGATPDVSQSFTLSITDVNEAPTALSFTNTTTSLAESASTASRIKVADLNVTDDALGTETLSLGGTDSASFEIISGVLYLKAGVSLNFETKSSYSVTVNVDDATVGSNPDVSQTFTLTLSDVNEAPSLNWTGSSAQAAGVTWNGATHAFAVPETLATGVTLGLLATTDPDGGAFAALRYELTGANASRFAINATTGAISLVNALNYEASPNNWSVGVTVWDGGAVGAGLSSSGTITIAASDVNEAPSGAGFAFYYGGSVAANTTVGTVSASDPEGSAITYSIYSVSRALTINGETTTTSLATSTYSITTGGLTKIASGASVVNGGYREDTITIKVTDAQGNFSYITSSAIYDRSAGGGGPGGGGGGGGNIPPIVLDLNGDGITLTSLQASEVGLDVTGDGLVDAIGWIGADDGFLALDRNGDGVIAGVEEIMFSRDATGAASDLEGLRAYDTDNSGFLDAGDAQFAGFRVWQDANSDGVAQAGEVTDLAGRQISAINLTLNLTGQNPSGATDNVLYGTTSYIRNDGSVGTVGDVFLHYRATIMQSSGLPPIVFDLDGGGLTLTSRLASNVRFDADNDGASERIGWFGAGEGVLALDRNGDGAIGSGAEISFTQDFEGAITDLQGLRAYDTDQNGFFDLNDARFGEFLIWQDANQNGVSETGELRSLADWNISAVSLTPVLTGASLEGADDNVVYATSVFVRSDGTRGDVGDVYLSFDESAPGMVNGDSPAPDQPLDGTNWCGFNEGDEKPAPTPLPPVPNDDGDRRAAWLNRLQGHVRHPLFDNPTSEVDWIRNASWRGRLLGANDDLTDPGAPTSLPPGSGTSPTANADDDNPVVRTADNPRRVRGQHRRSAALDWIDRNEVVRGEDLSEPFLAPARGGRRSAQTVGEVEGASALVAAASEEAVTQGVGALGLAGVTEAPRSALHAGLALGDKRVLHMVNAMAAFAPQSASDLARSGRQRDPRVAAMMTSLPDVR